MENNKKLISVGLPVYNGENFIREALDSVLSQTYSNFELIISDNGSTDGTEEICREYEKKDSRIKYVRHPKNQGGFFNYNYCIRAASSPYFTWLAHDDILEKSYLEEMINYMLEHKECLLVSGDFEVIDESGSTIRIEKIEKLRDSIKWKKRSCEFFRYPQSKICFFMYGVMKTDMIRKTYKDSRNSNTTVKGGEMPILASLATEGEIVSIPMVLRKYRQHSASAYNTEFSRFRAQSILKRNFLNLVNLYEIRLKQMEVLLTSNYPISQKFYIITSVYGRYIKQFFKRIFRAPKKIYSSLR